MRSLRAMLLPLLGFLLLAFGVGASTLFMPSPAFAQTQPAQQAPPPPQQQAAPTGFFDYLTSLVTATDTKAVYKVNAATFESAPCWGCDVFNAFSAQTFSAGRKVSGESAGPLSGIIVSVASLFALFYLGSSFVSGDASDLLSRWKTFWGLCIAVAFGTAWLSGGAFDNTWNYIYSPLMSIPMAVADAVPGGAATTGCSPASPSVSGAPTGAGAIIQQMYGTICGGHKISMKGFAFGLTLAGSGDGLVGTVLNIMAGFAVMVIFMWIAISFPLRFIDALLRLTVVGIVTPVLVVCAVFRPTRGYVQIGISNVLYAGCLFAFTSIMFKLGSSFFDRSVDTRIASLMANTWNPATMISDSVVVVGSGIVFAAMLKMAPALAQEFSQFRGDSGGVGGATANFASSVVTLPVKAAAAGIAIKSGGAIAGKMGTQMGSQAGAAAGNAIKGGLQKGVTGKD